MKNNKLKIVITIVILVLASIAIFDGMADGRNDKKIELRQKNN